jgi:membrane-anchored glycerophosphoryl diester phosphodiesterase (GDPDase)
VALSAMGTVTVSWWLRVKLFLLLPAASLEKLPGFAPVRRSWQLTRGIGGLVFSTLLVVGLAEGVVVGLGGQVASVLVTPSLAAGDLGGLVTLVAQLMPAITVGTVISCAVTALTWPFLTVLATIVHGTLTGYRLTPLMSG